MNMYSIKIIVDEIYYLIVLVKFLFYYSAMFYFKELIELMIVLILMRIYLANLMLLLV